MPIFQMPVMFPFPDNTMQFRQVDDTPRPNASRAPTPNKTPAERELEQLLLEKEMEEARERAHRDARNARIAELQVQARHGL